MKAPRWSLGALLFFATGCPLRLDASASDASVDAPRDGLAPTDLGDAKDAGALDASSDGTSSADGPHEQPLGPCTFDKSRIGFCSL